MLTQLTLLTDDIEVPSGTIVRLYNVNRFDLLNKLKDLKQVAEHDFYDFILVDLNVVQECRFILVNITLDNPNRGSIIHVFELQKYEYLKAADLKKYFGSAHVQVEM